MATKLQKAMRFTLLWMLVPASLAAVGYYVIGPRLGAQEAPVSEPRPDVEDEENEVPEPKSVRNYKPPAVEVTVKRGQTIRERDVRIPKPKPKPKPTPAQEAPATQPKPPVSTPPSEGRETIPVGDGPP